MNTTKRIVATLALSVSLIGIASPSFATREVVKGSKDVCKNIPGKQYSHDIGGLGFYTRTGPGTCKRIHRLNYKG